MLKAYDAGVECVGILKGWKGFIENKTVQLKIGEHNDLHTVGGTILFTSRTNPFKGTDKKEEKAKQLAKQFDMLGIDALIAIGGDLKYDLF